MSVTCENGGAIVDEQLSTVVQDGDRLQSLEAVRDKLATELDDAAGREAAPLARELRMVLAEIDSLAPPKEGSQFDQLAARRAARLADAEDQPDTGRQPRRGRRGGRPG